MADLSTLEVFLNNDPLHDDPYIYAWADRTYPYADEIDYEQLRVYDEEALVVGAMLPALISEVEYVDINNPEIIISQYPPLLFFITGAPLASLYVDPIAVDHDESDSDQSVSEAFSGVLDNGVCQEELDLIKSNESNREDNTGDEDTLSLLLYNTAIDDVNPLTHLPYAKAYTERCVVPEQLNLFMVDIGVTLGELLADKAELNGFQLGTVNLENTLFVSKVLVTLNGINDADDIVLQYALDQIGVEHGEYHQTFMVAYNTLVSLMSESPSAWDRWLEPDELINIPRLGSLELAHQHTPHPDKLLYADTHFVLSKLQELNDALLPHRNQAVQEFLHLTDASEFYKEMGLRIAWLSTNTVRLIAKVCIENGFNVIAPMSEEAYATMVSDPELEERLVDLGNCIVTDDLYKRKAILIVGDIDSQTKKVQKHKKY